MPEGTGIGEGYFFSEELGAQFGGFVGVHPSCIGGYRLCIHLGEEEPLDQEVDCLHLNPADRTGRIDLDSGRQRHTYADGASTITYKAAPTDAEPRVVALGYELWVRWAIGMLQAGLIAAEMQEVWDFLEKPEIERDDHVLAMLEPIVEFPFLHPLRFAAGLCYGLLLLRSRRGPEGRDLLRRVLDDLRVDQLADPWLVMVVARSIPRASETFWAEQLEEALIAASKSPDLELLTAISDWIAETPAALLRKRWNLYLLHNCSKPELLAHAAVRLQGVDREPELAIDLLKRAVYLQPHDATTLNMLQGAHLWAGQHEAAAELDESLAAESAGDGIQAVINTYTRLCNDLFVFYRDKGVFSAADEPRVLELLRLERELHDFWRQRDRRGRAQAVRDHRFVNGGSLYWAAYLRDQGRYREAVDFLWNAVQDSELFKMRFAAAPESMGNFLSNALGSCIDSKDPVLGEIGADVATLIVAVFSPIDSPVLTYQLACVFGLAGDIEAAFSQAQRAVELGESPDTLWGDSDLELLRGDPRFRQLCGR